MRKSDQAFFNSLQVFRGLAALMIVFHHQWNSFSHFMELESPALNFMASIGKYGVDFFFVLSGFIITYSNSNFHKKGASHIKTYFQNRVMRIYIPYLPIGILMLIVYTFFGSLSAVNREVNWFTSMTLIPYGTPALSVAWTLIHEMIFYILFIICFFSKRVFTYFVLLWIVFILDYNYFGYLADWYILPEAFDYLFSFYNLGFILGYFLARMYLRNSQKNYHLLGVGTAFFLAIIYLKWSGIQWLPHTYNFLYSASFALIILGGLSSKLNNLKLKNVFMILGNASYSIYLIHNPLISILVRMFPSTDNLSLIMLLFSLSFLLCCLAGIIYSKIFEAYIIERLKSKILKRMPLALGS